MTDDSQMWHQPDFLVVAAPRCGTTSLYSYLQQHPQIQMSRQKEPAFFHFVHGVPAFEEMADRYGRDRLTESVQRYQRVRTRAVTNPSLYSAMWTDDSSVLMRGEATPTYLFDPATVSFIRKELPIVKAILLLRNPVDRAYSQYLQYLRHGFETIYDFEQALNQEPVEVEAFWWGERRYLRTGLYGQNLERWFRLFGQSSVRVFLYEDLDRDPVALLNDVVQFLGVDESHTFDTSVRRSTAFVPEPNLAVRITRSEGSLKRLGRVMVPDRMRNRLYKRIIYRRQIVAPPLLRETRDRLTDFFRSDVRRLQELIDRDLSSWLETE
jgi:hypothetical protein